MKSAKVNFLKGAVIIAVANILVKVIGAAFKIPLARYVLGPDGMGIYNTAYTVYNWLFVISTAGLPVAISKMVSESMALHRYQEAKRIFRVSRWLLMILGGAGGAVLLAFARPFANLFQSPSAYYSLLAMAPSLLFVALMSAYRGFFQGMQNMIPTAVSEVAEAMGKLAVGLLAGLLLLPLGKEYASAGAIVGVSTRTVLGALVLVGCALRFKRQNIWFYRKSGSEEVQPVRRILRRLVQIAVPITLGTSVFTFTNMIDVYMIKERLMRLGWSEMLRETWYGYYSGYAMTILNLPLTVVIALSVSAVPAISAALAVYRQERARRLTESVLRVTVLFAVPCAVGLFCFAGPILNLLYADENAALLLQILSLAAVTMCLVTISNAVLQAAGRVWLPVIHTLIGCIVKVFANYFLVGMAEVNISGAPIATNLCYLVIVALNLAAVHRIVGARYKVGDFLVKPLAAGVCMGAGSACVYVILAGYAGATAALAAAIVAAVVLYAAALLLVRGLQREDLKMLPFGEKMFFLLDKFGILK